MQQAQANIEDADQGLRGLPMRRFICQLFLGDLHIPIREIGPEEFIDLASGFAVLEVLQSSRSTSRTSCWSVPRSSCRPGSSPDRRLSSTSVGPPAMELIALMTKRPAFQILLAKLRLASTFLGPTLVSLPGVDPPAG